MSNEPEELERDLELLRAQVASLTTRVSDLEALTGRTPAKPAPPPFTARVVPATPSHVSAPAAANLPAGAVPSSPVTPPGTLPTRGAAPRPPLPSFAHVQRTSSGDLEQKIGQYWLNRIGIVAVLTGISYFLKYAFDNNWIGPGGRVAIGLLAGIALLLWSERFRARGHAAFSYSLKALGLGAFYLSLWAAFQMYHLIPVGVAFAAMVAVTASAIVLAWTQNALILAAFALAGGFATPILLSTGENHEAELSTYVAILDIAVLVLIMLRPWFQLAWGSFIGTGILFVAWGQSYYQINERPETLTFYTLFALIFAVQPLLAKRDENNPGPRESTASVLAVLNAAAYFFGLYVMYEFERATLTWFALALAAAYLLLADAFRRFAVDSDLQTLRLVHITIAITFLTIAIPLKLEGHWITIGWIVESAALLGVAARTKTRLLGILGLLALLLGIFRMLLFSGEQAPQLIFNARFFTYLLAIAVLAAVVKYGEPLATENERIFFTVGKLALSALALTAMTLEASDLYDRQVAGGYGLPQRNVGRDYGQWRVVRDFTYSAIWLIYGAALMTAGFWKRSAFVRWQALVLIAFTVVKVFLYDVAALDKGYRIVSFVALGAVLLAISFIYQRDWLQLSRHEEGSAQ